MSVRRIPPEEHYERLDMLDRWLLSLPYRVKVSIQSMVNTTSRMQEEFVNDARYAASNPRPPKDGS